MRTPTPTSSGSAGTNCLVIDASSFYFPQPPCAVLTLLWQVIAAAENGGWTVGPRKIPPPLGASAQLRQSIAAAPKPDVEAVRSVSPKSAEDWIKITLSPPEAQKLADLLLEAVKRFDPDLDIENIKRMSRRGF
jgi:hypothetical protein